jgi:hypothetical protein
MAPHPTADGSRLYGGEHDDNDRIRLLVNGKCSNRYSNHFVELPDIAALIGYHEAEMYICDNRAGHAGRYAR